MIKTKKKFLIFIYKNIIENIVYENIINIKNTILSI